MRRAEKSPSGTHRKPVKRLRWERRRKEARVVFDESRKQSGADFAPTRYRGRRPRGGLTPGQIGVTAVTVILAVLVMTMNVNSQWCGKTCGEQLYEAVFVTEDWS